MGKEQIKVNNHLERLMIDTSLEGMGYARKFIEYYNLKGFNVQKFKQRQAYRESLMLSVSCN